MKVGDLIRKEVTVKSFEVYDKLLLEEWYKFVDTINTELDTFETAQVEFIAKQDWCDDDLYYTVCNITGMVTATEEDVTAYEEKQAAIYGDNTVQARQEILKLLGEFPYEEQDEILEYCNTETQIVPMKFARVIGLIVQTASEYPEAFDNAVRYRKLATVAKRKRGR